VASAAALWTAVAVSKGLGLQARGTHRGQLHAALEKGNHVSLTHFEINSVTCPFPICHTEQTTQGMTTTIEK
jgi:hypothetical protein